MNTEYPLIKPIPQHELIEGARVLANNMGQSTHFIEVWKFGAATLQSQKPIPTIFKGTILGESTIAIFKIRSK